MHQRRGISPVAFNIRRKKKKAAKVLKDLGAIEQVGSDFSSAAVGAVDHVRCLGATALARSSTAPRQAISGSC